MPADRTDRYAVPPERLARWLERWAERHGGVADARLDAAALTLTGADGATVRCEPPFPPLPAGANAAPMETLLEHVQRPRTVGVLLVRLGGHAAGIFTGSDLRTSKVGSRLVHGRHRAGGSSANRFRRRRALAEVLEDPRLAPVAALAVERVIDVPDPRRAVLEAAPGQFLATHLLVQEP